MEDSRTVPLELSWWAFLLRGTLAMAFGLFTFVVPAMALTVLVFAFGVFSMSEGILSVAASFGRRNEPARGPWWALLLQGLAGVIAGLAALLVPGITALALLYVIAGWSVASGVFAIAAAARLRKRVQGEWVLALTGVLSILFGVLVGLFPDTGALALTLWIGAYALVLGVLLAVLGVALRRHHRTIDGGPREFPAAAGHAG